jgi:hypothetical protein
MKYNPEAYMSFTHRGFLVQQSMKGWSVPQLPNRFPNGTPVSPGPYATRSIAEHVIDTVLDFDQSTERVSHSYDYNSPDYSYSGEDNRPLWGKILFWIICVLVALWFFGGPGEKQIVGNVILFAWNIVDFFLQIIINILKAISH